MSDPTVKMEFQGDSSSAARALAQLQRKYEKLEQGMKHANRTGKRGQDQFSAGLGKQISGLARIAAGYLSIGKSIGVVIAAQEKARAGIAEFAGRIPEARLKAQIQAGATPEQMRKVIPQIQKALLEIPSTDYAGGLDIHRQLVSSGFSAKDVKSGDALRAALALKAATNQFGQGMGNVSESIQSVAMFLKAQGIKAPTAGQILRTGGGLTQLFEGSDIQFPDLKDLAGQAAALKEKGLTPQMQMAAFSAIRDVKTAPEAATGLRQVVSRLQGASLVPAKVRALTSIGIDPKSIDLIGEDLPTALDRLDAALSKVSPNAKSDVLLTLFGEKGEAAGATLLGKRDVIRERLKILQGGALERNLAIFQTSEYAGRAKLHLAQEFAQGRAHKRSRRFTEKDLETVLNIVSTNVEGKNLGFLQRAQFDTDLVKFWASRKIGALAGTSPRELVEKITKSPYEADVFARELRTAMSKFAENQEKTIEEQKKSNITLTNLLHKNGERNPNANRE